MVPRDVGRRRGSCLGGDACGSLQSFTRVTIYFSFIPSHQGRSAQTINNTHSVKYSAKGFRIGPGLAPSREARDGEDEEAGQGRKRVRARGPPRPRARKPAVVEETGGGDEDADADEEAPLSRRRGRKLR